MDLASLSYELWASKILRADTLRVMGRSDQRLDFSTFCEVEAPIVGTKVP